MMFATIKIKTDYYSTYGLFDQDRYMSTDSNRGPLSNTSILVLIADANLQHPSLGQVLYDLMGLSSHLLFLGDDVHQQSVEHSQAQGQVDIAVKGCHRKVGVRVGHGLKKASHGLPVLLQEVIHEEHVLLLLSKPRYETVVLISAQLDRGTLHHLS